MQIPIYTNCRAAPGGDFFYEPFMTRQTRTKIFLSLPPPTVNVKSSAPNRLLIFMAKTGQLADWPARLLEIAGRARLVPDTSRRAESFLSLAGLALIIPALAANFLLLPQTAFAPVYVLISLLTTWVDGKKAGLLITLAGVVGLFLCLVHIGQSLETTLPGILMLSVVSLSGVLIVATARHRVDHLKQQVAARVTALECEINDRCQTEEKLDKAMQQFRQLAENIADGFWIKDPVSRRFLYLSPAYERIWQCAARDFYQSSDAWLATIHPEDRPQVSHALAAQCDGAEFIQKYRIIRSDGATCWIRDRAFPIRDGVGRLTRIVGIAEDVTEQHRLERQILEISDREQARIGQDLHDGLCQKLVSAAFDSNSLEQQLSAARSPAAAQSRRIAATLDDAITEARLVSRGLFPVQLEANGLAAALQQLADSVASHSGLSCRFQCLQPVSVRDNAVATHLYRIAQEAVTNAIKHGRPGRITVHLKTTEARIDLKITDDGIGLGVPVKTSAGLGLHTMNYRARTIGGVLTIGPAPGHGVEISCSVPQQSA